MKPTQTIFLHAEAPAKPNYGSACNGCGVCCAAEPCPVAYLLLWQYRGRCRALLWQAAEQRYACGLLLMPQRYIRWWLPRRMGSWLSAWIAKRIAAGVGCDSNATLE